MFLLVDSDVSGLSVISSTHSVLLSWQPLMNITGVTFEYEVAYISVSECPSNSASLPNGYTVYSPKTTSNSIEVFGLMADTCYVFGVRAYTSVSDSVGEFSIIDGVTMSSGKIIESCIIMAIFIINSRCSYSNSYQH